MHSSAKFQLATSKFAQVKQFRANVQKIQNLKKFECLNRFWPNSIPKVLDQCNIFVCGFRTIAQILRKLERTFVKKFKIPFNHKLDINFYENRHKKRDVTISLVYQISCRYRKPFIMSYRGLRSFKSDTRTNTHTHPHYSEYSDTNISNFFFAKTASSVRKQNSIRYFR